MKKRLLCLTFGYIAALTACSSTMDTSSTLGPGGSADGPSSSSSGSSPASSSSSSSGSSPASSSSSSGSPVDCTPFKGDAAQPVTIRVENKTSSTVVVQDSCHEGTPNAIFVDMQSAIDPFTRYSCSDTLTCTNQDADCFPGPGIEIAAGSSNEYTWDGLLLTGDPLTVPAACIHPSCLPLLPTCQRMARAAPGAHTLRVTYSVAGGSKQQLDVPFTLPTSSVTATIMP